MAITEEPPELIMQYSARRFTLRAPMCCVWNVICKPTVTNITFVRTLDVVYEKILCGVEKPQVSNN